jgi:coenzyme Q-binding protein COQ10
MFGLVADVERYPEFVPLCRAMRVLRRATTDDREVVVAQMTVAYKLRRSTALTALPRGRPKSASRGEFCRVIFDKMQGGPAQFIAESHCAVESWKNLSLKQRAGRS